MPVAYTLQPWQVFLTALAGWINRHQQAAIDFLREENRVLLEQLGDRRIRLTDEQRRRLAVVGKAVGRKALADLAGLDLPKMLETANIEGRKEFVRAFIGGITVRPDTGVLDLQMKKLPALVPGNFTCEMVAGARYTPLQIEMKPLNLYLAGLRWAA